MYLATKPSNRRRVSATAFLIGADDSRRSSGIESRRERGRADKVAEHDRELAPFGGVARQRVDGGGGLCVGSARRIAERGNRLHQPLSVSERHSELLEVAFAQLRQHLAVDLVRAEHRLVLSEAEAPQPAADIHEPVTRMRDIIILYARTVCPEAEPCSTGQFRRMASHQGQTPVIFL